MLISTDANELVATFRRIFAAAQLDGLPPLHAGIAWGPALPRTGDWIGRTVNLAARISAVAKSETILIDQATRDRLDLSRFPCETAGIFALKGYDGGRELYRLT